MGDQPPTPKPAPGRAYTLRELVDHLTSLAPKLPQGWGTPVNAGIVTYTFRNEDGSPADGGAVDSTPAISIEPVTAKWPCGCEFTTVDIFGEPMNADVEDPARHPTTGHLGKR